MGVRDPAITRPGPWSRLRLDALPLIAVALLLLAFFTVGVQGLNTTTRGPPLTRVSRGSSPPALISRGPSPRADTPATGDYTLRDGNDTICMRMQFSCQLNITYQKINQETGKVVVNLNPDIAQLVSNCEQPKRKLTIYPFPEAKSDWQISLEFKEHSGSYAMTAVSLGWAYDGRFVDSSLHGWGSESYETDNILDQQVQLGNYYTCPQPLNLTTGQATLLLANLQLQPFAQRSSGGFGKAEGCAPGLSQTTIIIIAASCGGGVLCIIAVIAVVIVVKKKKYSVFQNVE